MSERYDCQHQGGRELGLAGLVNSGEAVLNVVSNSKPKMLIGLDQKVRGQVRGLIAPPAQMLDHRRRAATFPSLATAAQRGKPVVLPQGTASRKASRWGGG